MNKLVLGLPKGSLQEATYTLFKSGLRFLEEVAPIFHLLTMKRSKFASLHPQEMSRYVEQGMLDAGIAGLDWIEANGSDVVDLCGLVSQSRRKNRCAGW